MRAVRLRRNHCFNAAFCEHIQQGVRAKGLVTNQCREGNVLEKIRHRHEIMARTGQDNTTDQHPDRVRSRHTLARPTALRAADAFIRAYESPFLTRRFLRTPAGSCRPPTRPTDRIPPITQGQYDQKDPFAPTG